MMKKNILLVFAVMSSCFMLSAHAEVKVYGQNTGTIVSKGGDPNFPLRSAFPFVKTISTDELAASLNDVLVVDVRTPFENRVMRVRGSKSLEWPILMIIGGKAHQDFVIKFKALMDASPNKKVVIYCNGPTCSKSFDASRFIGSKENQINDVIVYDGGMSAWVSSKPDLTDSFEGPIKKETILSKDAIKKHTLPAKSFTEAVSKDTTAVVVDLRTQSQRDSIAIFPARDIQTNGLNEEKILKAINEARSKNVTLYIYDFLGLQTTSVQYLLEKEGFVNYFFMQGGTSGKDGYFKTQ